MTDPMDDGGFASRKWLMCCAAALLIAAAGLVGALWLPALIAIYPTLIGGVLGACGLYCGSNIANTFVVSRAPAPTSKPTQVVDQEPLG